MAGLVSFKQGKERVFCYTSEYRRAYPDIGVAKKADVTFSRFTKFKHCNVRIIGPGALTKWTS